jgi:hypothetical protein
MWTIKTIIITILFIPSMIYAIYVGLKIRKKAIEMEIKYKVKQWNNKKTNNL